ncbi:MAG TPA: SufD family Fe-S cluster assembly protein, partial [Pseudobdellovibrionaceae bacterium]|nr:SufD family Fe-S cluster assembly protein [Pseudobdellovibrionaceae bacterium]
VLGLSVSTDSQHVDNTTDIDHRVGACDTEQIYKSLLDGESRAVFNGRIYIRPQAQKANSSQLNNNLLMSSKAEADSQPQLMIEADDVKAAHGSTVGHLNAEELFYLRSRGIPRRVAVPLLAYGFLADLLEDIDHEGMKAWVGA